jgi:hypothetical protein
VVDGKAVGDKYVTDLTAIILILMFSL